jgi:pimeloyl-ACP methyl ester carboxylesterase
LHTFDGWAKELEKKYRVLRFDLPGFGLTHCPESTPFTMDYFLSFINKFADYFNANEFHLAGNSLGGWLAWEYALLNQARVKKLILIDAAGFVTEKTLPFMYKIARTSIAKCLFFPSRYKPIFYLFAKGVYGNPERIEKEIYQRYYDLFFYNGNLKSLLKVALNKIESNYAKLNELVVPTLIIWGDKDKWVSINDAYKFKELIKNSEIIIYKGLGHVPMEEDPEITVKDLILFIE